ncbi:MAG: NAD(+) synthase [Bacteroidetes bacterium]|jgi:NAD+ synthase (glutamine-hydrolysing)|nr:NAD(+) synthase [Bacteroidota bacterium]
MPLQTEINVAVAQMNVVPGHPDKNVKNMVRMINEAVRNKDDVIVFPEMAVPGYFLGDEWENEAFIKDAFEYNEDIINASGGLIVIWGNIDIDWNQLNEDGRVRKFNAAFIAQNGKLIGKTHKTLLPKYREFEDARHFYSMRKEAWDNKIPAEELLKPFTLKIKGKDVKLGLILCEDMWSDDYSIDPVKILQQHESEIIFNVSCSPWTWRKNDKRHRVVADRLKDYPVPFIYANNIGIQNNGKNIYLFEGNSTIYNQDGSIFNVAHNYTEELLRATITNKVQKRRSAMPVSKEMDSFELYQGLTFGIKKLFESLSNPSVVIGISGGIDSALSATLLSLALGPEKVYAVNMPSRYNSETTKSAALKLAENLQINYASVTIQESFDYTLKQLNNTVFERMDGSGSKTPVCLSDLNEENVQARDRGARILAGIASALGAVFVNNGNKTETAIGYATLYGDVNGAVSILGDLYKMEVYQLAGYINQIKGSELIPRETMSLPASAELSAAQNVDENMGDPVNFPYHDKLLRAFIEFRLDPENILEMYKAGTLTKTLSVNHGEFESYFSDVRSFIDDLEHKWRLFKMSYFKRIQSPPIIVVSKRAFGFDLRESQNGVYFTRRYKKLKDELLVNNRGK